MSTEQSPARNRVPSPGEQRQLSSEVAEPAVSELSGQAVHCSEPAFGLKLVEEQGTQEPANTTSMPYEPLHKAQGTRLAATHAD
jgi:hypothetical protein